MTTICNRFDKDVKFSIIELYDAGVYQLDDALRKDLNITATPLVTINLLPDNIKVSSSESNGEGGKVYKHSIAMTIIEPEQYAIDKLSELSGRDLVVRAVGSGSVDMLIGYKEQPLKLTFKEVHPSEANKFPYLSVKISGKTMVPAARKIL